MGTQPIKWAATLAILFFAAKAPAELHAADLPAQHRGVGISFFVTDAHGRPTPQAISQVDLRILDNKKPSQSLIALRTAKESPLRMGVLIDTSKSEGGSNLYRPEVKAIADLLNQMVNRADDKAFIVSFATTSNGTPFMSGQELLKLQLDLRPGGGTALFDAVHFACKFMEADATQPARRVLVVLSDGGDNQSHYNHDEAIAAAQESGTVVFAVSTNEDDLGSKKLKQFADGTGGLAFLHLKRDDIASTFASIREQIENMYTVIYIPADPGKPGQFHPIELKVVPEKNVKVRAPKGYYITN